MNTMDPNGIHFHWLA